MDLGPNEIIYDLACESESFSVRRRSTCASLKDSEKNSVLSAPKNMVHFNDGIFYGFDLPL